MFLSPGLTQSAFNIDQKGLYWPFSSFSQTMWGKSREILSQEEKQRLMTDIQAIIKKTAPLHTEQPKVETSLVKSFYHIFMMPIKLASELFKTINVTSQTNALAASSSTLTKESSEKSIQKIALYTIPTGFLKYYIPRFPKEFIGANDTELSHIHIYNSGRVSEPLSFGFGACDWHVFYELGVALALSQILTPDILDHSHFLGSAGGSVVALAMVMNMDIQRLKEALQQAYETQFQFLGFNSPSNIFESILTQITPNNISRAGTRLFVSMTKDTNFEKVLKNQFTSKKVI
jgi:hypothetical protein